MGRKELEYFRAKLEQETAAREALAGRVAEAQAVAATASRNATLARAELENVAPKIDGLLSAAEQAQLGSEGTAAEYLSELGGTDFRVMLWLAPDGQIQATVARGLVVVSPAGVWMSGHVLSIWANPNDTLEGIVAALAEAAGRAGTPF